MSPGLIYHKRIATVSIAEFDELMAIVRAPPETPRPRTDDDHWRCQYQADARAIKRETGQTWAEVEVPTDKTGLIGFLNENALAIPARPAPTPPTVPTPAIETHLEAALDATSVLARMDNPGLGIDAIIEGIAAMKGGYALKRVAGAVAIRFEELSR